MFFAPTTERSVDKIPQRHLERRHPMLTAVREFKNEVLDPFMALSQSRLPNKLESKRWMGLEGAGYTFEDLPPEEAEELIQLIGPGAFKVVRFSRDLLQRLRAAKKAGTPIITSGGSCLLTAADKNAWKNSPLSPDDLRRNINALPNMMQIFDASLPVLCADEYVNIIEDSLFVELAQECSNPKLTNDELAQLLRNEGTRHSAHFTKLTALFGATAPVNATHFADLPVKEYSDRFWQTNEVFEFLRRHRIMPFGGNLNAQFQVLFSFSGAWANMLRELGRIPQNSCYLVVEPFHHFTEASEKDERCEMYSERWHAYAAFDELMTSHIYGQPGVNQGVQGAIAFLPVLSPMAQLGHTNMKLEDCCSLLNFDEYLSQRAEALTSTKVPNPPECLLFVDGVNYLYHKAECRAALSFIMQQTVAMRAEANTASKNDRKDRLKALRTNPQNLKATHACYQVLFTELENLCYYLFC
ncbi:MAG: hypothetical protein UT32_C0003G0019 [Parcubacteria group bacterium GW2011_GWC2_39_14]|nr:MAG: hypothetical protein UT32_C0003G0019 [Parcubacteria group bacterium GW2011_GWC2_39_14]KKR54968.1 MAG: hypothetical protein UT91_C0006G0019 [Parcubacteria group bacterium GW2011_GWA2_40_23]